MSGTLFSVEPSPFHDRAAELCCTNAWVRVGRLTLVEVYGAVEAEYWAAKADAALFDLSARRSYRIRGPEAADGLEHLIARRIDALEPGHQLEIAWCGDTGLLIGHGMLCRESPDSFLIVTDEPCLGWIEDTLAGFDCAVSEESRALARLGLQGPAAQAVLEAMGLTLARRLEPMRVVQGGLRGLAIGLSRRDETRFELWAGQDEARVLWDRLMAAGRPLGLKPAGTAAQTVLRLEAGEPRLGVDFTSALAARFPAEMVRPEAVGLEALIDRAKTGYVGQPALAFPTRPSRRLVRLLAETAEPLQGGIIGGHDRQAMGYLTSWGYAPAQGASLAFGWIEGDPAAVAGLVLPPDAGSAGQLRHIGCRIL